MTIDAAWESSAIRARWQRLSEDDCARIGGEREQLLASLVELYGWTPEDAEIEVASWERDVEEGRAKPKAARDAVARASADSFPASDPPGWIKQAPRAPVQAGPPPRAGAALPRLGSRKRARRSRSPY